MKNKLAKLKYLPNKFEIIEPGDHVICAVSKQKVYLQNLMHFLRLRADSHAQYEIQIYAEKMVEILKKWVPLTYEAFEDYRSDSFQLSKEALKIVKDKLANKKIKKSNYKLSPRELRELELKFNIKLS